MSEPFTIIRKSTPQKGEILRIARLLNITREQAFTLVAQFWLWAEEDASEDGVLTVTADDIDTLMARSGFSHALFEVSWLQVRSNGSLAIPNFARHMGELAKCRLANSGRQRRARQKRDKRVTESATNARQPQVTLEESKSLNSSGNGEIVFEEKANQEVVLVFPTVGKAKSWELTEAHVDHFRELFPDLDVLAQCRSALAWCEANQPKRKTPGGMPKFLASWLTRAQNSGQGKGIARGGNHEGLREFLKGEGYDAG